jgi:hypothetical protein
MRFERRPPRWDDGYSLVGLYFASMMAVAVVVAASLPARWLPRCALKRLTGIPCPTCGAWRAACALRRGEILEAWRCQPLLVTAAALLAAVAVYALVTALFGQARHFPVFTRRERRRLWLTLALLAAANWVYLMLDGR